MRDRSARLRTWNVGGHLVRGSVWGWLGRWISFVVSVRREPISKSCEITQADNLNRRRRLSRKAQ